MSEELPNPFFAVIGYIGDEIVQKNQCFPPYDGRHEIELHPGRFYYIRYQTETSIPTKTGMVLTRNRLFDKYPPPYTVTVTVSTSPCEPNDYKYTLILDWQLVAIHKTVKIRPIIVPNEDAEYEENLKSWSEEDTRRSMAKAKGFMRFFRKLKGKLRKFDTNDHEPPAQAVRYVAPVIIR
jgi:hypothetical protein